MSRTVRGKVAVVGIGETQYYKRGEAPDAEFKLALKAILTACEDAGISPKQIDGFASFSNDRSDPSHLAAALGIDDLRFANMQWGGAAAVARGPLPTRPRQLQLAWPSVSLCSGRWPRVNLADSDRDPNAT